MAWTEQHTFSLNAPVESDFDPDSKWVAAGADSGAAVEVWSLETGNSVLRLTSLNGRDFDNCGVLRFSPDGSIFSFAHQFLDDGSTEISHFNTSDWTRMSNATIDSVSGSTGFYCQIDYSPDGTYFVNFDGLNDVVEIRAVGGDETWTVEGTVPTDASTFRALGCCPGNYALIANRSGSYWLIDIPTATTVDTGTLTQGGAYQIEAHPSEPWFAIGGDNSGDPVTVNEVASDDTLNEIEQISAGTSNPMAASISEGHLYHTMQADSDDVVYAADAGSTSWSQETTIPLLASVWRADLSPDSLWLGINDRDADAVRVYDTSYTGLATVSGTFTLDGTGTGGATVRAINDTAGEDHGTVTTDTNGDFSIEFPIGDEGHFAVEYENPDTGEMVKTESKPFIVVQ